MDTPRLGSASSKIGGSARPFLSAELRLRTAQAHRQTERQLGLPGAIDTRDDYAAWLARFFGFYEPLERQLAYAGAWPALGLVNQPASHASRLSLDLAALSIDTTGLPRVPLSGLPALRNPAQAIGVCYVLEGAALGGRVILRALEGRIGSDILGATRFFGDRSDGTVLQWKAFQAALDDFGHANPHLRDDVEVGATSTFRTMLAWFTPFCAVAEHGS